MNNYHNRIHSSRLIVLMSSLVFLGSCRSVDSAAKADSPQASSPQALSVQLAPVESSRVENSSEFVANLESRKSVTLQPRAQGQVTQILVRAGEFVKAGTVLMKVDPSQQQAVVSSYAAAAGSAQANIENARAELKTHQADRLERQADLKLRQQQYDRFSKLYASGATSADTRDQYANQLAAAKAGLGAVNARIDAQKAAIARAEKGLRQAQANTQQQQVQLDYFNVTAPFDGTVGDLPVKVGDYVSTSTALVNLTQNRPLEVNVSIPAEQATRIQQNTPVQLLDSDGKPVGTSRVFFIAPNVAGNTQSVLIKALYDNPNGRLRADQQVKAKVIWDRQNGLSIPVTAISRVAGENFVFVAEQNSSSGLVARQRPVKLGNIQGNTYQVLDGLKPGERVATSGLLKLTDGAAIASEEGKQKNRKE